MKPPSNRRFKLGAVLLLVFALIAASCGDDDSESGDDGSPSTEPTQEATVDVGEPEPEATTPASDDSGADEPAADDAEAMEPVSGGEVTFGQIAGVLSLDPVQIPGGGTSGGNEAGAIYGYLMRYDTETNEYVPFLAESVSPNDDFSMWTLKLRAGMTFTDGEPYDAAAIVRNIERTKNPANRVPGGALLGFVDTMSIVDPTTIEFDLTQPWAGFPAVLSDRSSMIASPAFLDELEAGNAGATPIGAGPFKVESFQPGEKLSLIRNDDFVLGSPYLEKLNFVLIPGGPATYETFQTGDLQAAMISDAVTVDAVRQDGTAASETLQDIGSIVMMNQAEGSILADVRLREALSLAISPEIFNERVNEGKGIATGRLFPEGSLWYNPDQAEIPYDPDAAAALVEEVKADTGWDGTLRLVCADAPSNAAMPVAYQAMLEPIGIKLDVSRKPQSAVTLDVIVTRDFDLACWGYNVTDVNPFPNLYLWNYTGAAVNASSYSTPEMDAALDALRLAGSIEDQQLALDDVTKVWTETYPAINLGSRVELVINSDDLHDIVLSSQSVALFHQAWLG